MADKLVSADYLKKRFTYYATHSLPLEEYCYLQAMKEVDEAPSVDAVPVVRCRDCKYSRMYCFGCSDEPVLACCEIEEDDDGYEFIIAASGVEPDGYCSKGVRMDEEA